MAASAWDKQQSRRLQTDEGTMHELSIAMSIVEMAQEEAEQRGGVQVSAVHLKLGALSGVVKEALLSAYEIACDGTPLQASRLVIEEVPVVVFCPNCHAPRPLSSVQLFCCAQCGTPASEVVHGKELEVVALEIFQENEEWVHNPV
jgi:hydrogenase nickel incorporation protein HypA/HybF